MKITNLKILIRECIQEVLLEFDQDYSTTGVVKISKDDPVKQQKIQTAQNSKQSYELYEKNQKLKEMARIPYLYDIGDNADNITDKRLLNSPTVQGWLQYIRDNGPSSVNTVAKNAYDSPKRQQQLNPLVQPLLDLGILKQAGLKSEPKSVVTKKPKEKFGDSGEELFGDDDGDVEDEFVGFASKYGNKDWGEPEENEPSPEEEVPGIPSKEHEPSEDEIRAVDNYLDKIEDEDEDDDLDESEMVRTFQRRAGIKK